MKKVLSILKFIGLYLLITAVSAAGVIFIIPTSSRNAQIGNTDSGNISTGEEGNFTNIVNNLMKLNDFVVDAKVNVSDNKELDMGLALNLKIHAARGFSSVDAEGSIQVTHNNKTYDIDLTFLNNTLYVRLMGFEFTITTNNLTQAIGEILSLIDIDVDMSGMTEGFDMSMIATLLQGYEETETETGYDIKLTVMDYEIGMVCNKDFYVQEISVPKISLNGMNITADVQLDNNVETIVIEKPAQTEDYLDLSKLTNLLGCFNQIKESRYLKADVLASYKDYNLKAQVTADFKDQLKMLISSDSFGDDINFMYTQDSLYANFGNIKVKTTLQDVETLIDYASNTLWPKLQGLNTQLMDNLSQTLNTTINHLTTQLQNSNFSLQDIMDLLSDITINGDTIYLDIPNIAYIELLTSNNQVQSIKVTSGEFNFEINVVSITRQEIEFDSSNYLDFEDVFPTIKSLINSLTNMGLVGQANIVVGKTSYNVDINVKYVNNAFAIVLQTRLYGKDILIGVQNNTFYLAIDGIKIKVPFTDIDSLLNFVTTNFNITLPEFDFLQILKDVKFEDVSLSFIKDIQVSGKTLKIVCDGLDININHSNDLINNINVVAKDFNIAFDIFQYGDITVPTIIDNEFSHFDNLISFVQNITNTISNTSFKLDLNTTITINNNPINATIFALVDISNRSASLDLTFTYNSQRYVFNITYINQTTYISYDALKLKFDSGIFDSLKEVIINVLPDYVDISSIQPYLDILNSENGITDLLPQLDNDQIQNLLNKYVKVLSSISYSNNTLDLIIDLKPINSQFNSLANISISATTDQIELSVSNISVDNVYANLTAYVRAYETTIVVPYGNYVLINDYINLISTLNNTIRNKYLDINLNVKSGNIDVDANLIVDFTNQLKVSLQTNSLGSAFDIKYLSNDNGTQNSFYVTFGNLKLNCNIGQLHKLYNYITKDVMPVVDGLDIAELQPILDTINSYISQFDNLLNGNSTTPKLNINLNDVMNILNNIQFSENLITFRQDDIKVDIVIQNKMFKQIKLDISNTIVTIDILSNEYVDNFTFDKTTYLDFDKVYTKINALFDSLITKQLSGTLALEIVSGEYVGTYNLNYTLSYNNNQLFIDLSTTIFGQNIHIVYQDAKLYLTINELNLTASWEERQQILDYVNEKFGTNLTFPNLSLKDLGGSNKEFDLANINIDILDSITVDNQGIQIKLGDITIQLLNQGTIITNIQVFTSSINVDLKIENVGSQVELNYVNENDYQHYTVLTTYFDEISYLIDSSKTQATDQFTITGSAYLYETNFKGVPVVNEYADGSTQYKNYVKVSLDNLNLDTDNNLLNQLAIDLRATGSGEYYSKYLNGVDGEISAYFNSNNTDGGVYLNYNKLKVFLSKSSIKDIYNSVKDLIVMFMGEGLNDILNLIKFTDNNDVYVSLNNMPDLSANTNILQMLEEYAPMLTQLKLDSNKVLSIGIDTSSVTDMLKEPLVLKIYKDNNNLLHLAVDKLFIGNYQGISFDFTVDTMPEFIGVPQDNSNYMDLSNASGLLEGLKNTMEYKEFKLSTVVNLNIASIINIDVPVDIRLNLASGKPIVYAKIGEIPAVIGVNNDVPYVVGDTESGSNRMLYIYYIDGYVYFYRSEQVDIAFGISKRSYEKTLKITLDEFMDDALGLLLQYGFGFQNLVMDAINNAIAKANANTTPMDMSNILLGFDYNSSSESYNLKLNLGELSRNSDLKTMDLGLLTTIKDGKKYVNAITLYMSIDVEISIVLQTKSNSPLTLELGQPADVSSVINYANNYKYNVGEEWHASNGNWEQDSGDYTINFNTNLDGYTIPSVTQHVGTMVDLPEINSLKIVENGNDKDTYQFVGWCLDSACKGTVYTGQYKVNRGGSNLYAKWVLVESLRSVNFYVNGTMIDSQTAQVGTVLKDVQVDDLIIYQDNNKIIKTFDCWIDADGIKVTNIEAETQNVYASYKTVSTYTLYTIDFVDDITSAPASIINYNSHSIKLPTYEQNYVINQDGWTTIYKFNGWYEDAQFTTLFNQNTMPERNVTLYAKWDIVDRYQEFILTIYDNNQIAHQETLTLGEQINLPSSIKVDANTQWYTDANYSNQTVLPQTMPETSLNLHIRNKYNLTYVYYVNENNAHVEKTSTISLYQGEGFTLPSQTTYERDYDTNNDGVNDNKTGYVFNSYYVNNSALDSYTMINGDLYVEANWNAPIVKNYYTITFNSSWVKGGNWVANGNSANTSRQFLNDIRVLEGSTVQGTTLTEATSTLTNSTQSRSLMVYYYCKYALTGYNFESACWNTTGCKNLYTLWVGNSSPSNENITINGNKTLYVEWKNV